MRIYRDTRFSKDKTPYKTNLGIQFRHEAGKNVHAPGFYFHVDKDQVFVGAGVWHPDNPTLKKIRIRIDDDQAGWKRAKNGKRFRQTFELHGDSLKRPPQGFDPEHPLIDDLKRKDFICVEEFTEAAACKPGFIDRVEASCSAAGPFVKFLTEAVGQKF